MFNFLKTIGTNGSFLIAGLITLLTGCTSTQIQEYKNENPTLILENYLNGKLEAYGFFQNRSGKIVKRFKVSMNCTWKDNNGTLEEDFSYADGSKSRRVWSIKKQPNGTYIGTASDVIGEAIGVTSGNAFRWNYTLDLPVDNENYHVQFDDWMFLMEDGIMLNKSKMSKFGITLGEVTIAFVKK